MFKLTREKTAYLSMFKQWLHLQDFGIIVSKCDQLFIETSTKDNLPIKATLTHGYKFFQDEFIHDVEEEIVPMYFTSPINRCQMVLRQFCFGIL